MFPIVAETLGEVCSCGGEVCWRQLGLKPRKLYLLLVLWSVRILFEQTMYMLSCRNTFNVCKSITKGPCTILYATFPVSVLLDDLWLCWTCPVTCMAGWIENEYMNKTTRNRNTLLWYFGYNLPKQRTTFSSHNLTTTFRNSTRKNNSADR